ITDLAAPERRATPSTVKPSQPFSANSAWAASRMACSSAWPRLRRPASPTGALVGPVGGASVAAVGAVVTPRVWQATARRGVREPVNAAGGLDRLASEDRLNKQPSVAYMRATAYCVARHLKPFILVGSIPRGESCSNFHPVRCAVAPC